MTLTKKEKTKIIEEETFRSETRAGLEHKKKGSGCLVQLIALIFIFMVAGAIGTAFVGSPKSYCTNIPEVDIQKGFSIIKEGKVSNKYSYTISKTGGREPFVYSITFEPFIPIDLSTITLVEAVNNIYGSHTAEGDVKNINNTTLAIKIADGGYYCARPIFENPQKVLSLTFWKEK